MALFERLFALLIKPWMVVSCLGLMILFMLYLDQPIAYYFHGVGCKTTLYLMNRLTVFGWSTLYLVTLFGCAIFFRYIYRNKIWEDRSWFLWLCVVIPNLICLMLKVSLGRARPELLFSKDLYGFYGFNTHSAYWSFPSGHTSTVMGFVLGLSILFPRYWYLIILSGLFVVFSRIFLTFHYLSDVLVAIYLVLIELGLLLYFLKRKKLLQGCKF